MAPAALIGAQLAAPLVNTAISSLGIDRGISNLGEKINHGINVGWKKIKHVFSKEHRRGHGQPKRSTLKRPNIHKMKGSGVAIMAGPARGRTKKERVGRRKRKIAIGGDIPTPSGAIP